ncbi:MAG TPA: hypothetical protein P5136_02620 [Methanofastidiosum sp.]|nr:hypothetical protein [Methanofastidiosum sp.]
MTLNKTISDKKSCIRLDYDCRIDEGRILFKEGKRYIIISFSPQHILPNYKKALAHSLIRNEIIHSDFGRGQLHSKFYYPDTGKIQEFNTIIGWNYIDEVDILELKLSSMDQS